MRQLLNHIALFFLLLLAVASYGQEKKKAQQSYKSGSKISSFSRSGPTTDELLDQAERLLVRQPEDALGLVEDALLQAIDSKNQAQQARAYFLLGRINYKLNGYALAVKNFNRSKKLYEQLNMSDEVFGVQRQLGPALEASGDLEGALKAHEEFLEMAKARNSKEDISQTEYQIAGNYQLQGKIGKSKAQYNDLYAREKKAKNKRNVLEVSQKLGDLTLQEDSADVALGYYNESQSLALELDDKKQVNQAYEKLTSAYEQKQDLDEVRSTQEEAFRYNQAQGNMKEMVMNGVNIGNVLIEQGRGREALAYLDNSARVADENQFLEEQSLATKAISKAYEALGNSEEALKRYQEYVALFEQVHSIKETALQERAEKLQELEQVQQQLSLFEKDRELSEKTIDVLQKDQERQQSITIALSIGFLILLVGSIIILRTSRQKRIANQLLTLRSLRSQMNPHFIFNALNSVNNFISKSDERSANKYLSEFSLLMRQVMEHSQEDLIPLATELDILNRYLKLEHFRFSDKFEYEVQIAEQLDVDAFEVPPMLIQPYLENAVWHGLRYKDGKGLLTVDIRQDGETLLVEIKDDGIGRKRSQELKTANQKRNKSTGMRNIAERLKIINSLYKANVNVTITDLNEQEETGTRVQIRLTKNAKAA